MTLHLGTVLAFGVLVGCVTDNDDRVAAHRNHHSYRNADVPRDIDGIDDEDNTLEEDSELNAAAEEAFSGGELSENDVFVEDLDLQDAPEPKPYVQGTNTMKSAPLPRKLPPTPKMQNAKAAKVFYVKTRVLNVRQAPNTRAGVVRKLSRGQKITAIARQGQWVKIGGGQYVLGTHLTAQLPR